MKFMVLYMATPEAYAAMMRNATPEQQRSGMEAWMTWMNKNAASLLDGGAPLGKTVRVDDSGASDMRNGVGGYSIVQADSQADAAKLFTGDHPHLQMPGAWIEIMEIKQIPGM